MRMPISSETRAALELLKEVQTKVRQTEDLRNNRQVGADLNALISVLESPVFQSILNIQDSLRELKRQVSKNEWEKRATYGTKQRPVHCQKKFSHEIAFNNA